MTYWKDDGYPLSVIHDECMSDNDQDNEITILTRFTEHGVRASSSAHPSFPKLSYRSVKASLDDFEAYASTSSLLKLKVGVWC